MFKFFKAFRANPKLQIATATLSKSSTDIVHFMVVFLAIFISFAMIAHTSFGHVLYEFRSLGASVNTCFEANLGRDGRTPASSNAGQLFLGTMDQSSLALAALLPF